VTKVCEQGDADAIALPQVNAWQCHRLLLGLKCFYGDGLLKSLLFVLLLLTSMLPAKSVFAHSGGLNAQGCHAGSQPYHCHRPQRSSNNSAPATRNTSGDRDCADFRSWREAQDFYQSAGRGDPHRLDADNDGIACESLR
jgi:hypothetical protein